MHPDILEELYKKYAAGVFAYTFSLCKNREMAEDIVSEAFEKVLLSDMDGGESIRYWLLVVCKNAWLDRMKKTPPLPPEKALRKAAGPEDSPEEALLAKEKRDMVYAVILALDRRYREILLLHYYGGLPLSEAARLLGITAGAAKTLVFRARQKLKKQLEETGYAF